jgi:hypothetical protein
MNLKNRKMKNTQHIFILIALAMAFTGCEKEISLKEMGNYPDKVVVNGLVYADSTARIHIARSIGVLDKSSKDIALINASAIMTKNNSTYSFQHDTAGFYELKGDTPVSGAYYILSVSNAGFDPIQSFVTIPPQVNLLSVDTSVSLKSVPGCSTCELSNALKIEMNIESPASEKEYLIVSLSAVGTYQPLFVDDFLQSEDDSTLQEYQKWIYSYDSYLKLVKSGERIQEVFDDGFFSGRKELFFVKPEGEKNYKLTIYHNNFKVWNGYPEYTLSITKITEDYYKHQLSLARATYASNDFLAEKVSIYTNIENGMGVLGGANQTIKVLDFSNYME